MGYIIQFENLSKCYMLRHQTQQRYVALRDIITDAARSAANRVFHPFRTHARQADSESEQFWALKDVSFTVKEGERVGIIGRNGAGKSTLLKVLSRITEPTSGRVSIKGRVASLLEVGTGFHPELTGRENVFLNGAILGMSKSEIKRKFDEIVAFAEVEQFLDTPVKHYSSGMYVRLAFSVAAHLEPEVLVVDEVLAVGDVAFQNKCLGKMEAVAKSGRTILFVSHNLGSIQNLCTRCVLLNKGSLVQEGDPASVIMTYVSQGVVGSSDYLQEHMPRKQVNLRKVSLSTTDGQSVQEFRYDQPIRVNIEYEVNEPAGNCSVWVGVRTVEQTLAFGTADTDSDADLFAGRGKGYYHTTVILPAKWLNAGRYFIVVGITKYPQLTNYDRVECASFTIHDTGTPEKIRTGQGRPGILQPFLTWDTKSQPENVL